MRDEASARDQEESSVFRFDWNTSVVQHDGIACGRSQNPTNDEREAMAYSVRPCGSSNGCDGSDYENRYAADLGCFGLVAHLIEDGGCEEAEGVAAVDHGHVHDDVDVDFPVGEYAFCCRLVQAIHAGVRQIVCQSGDHRRSLFFCKLHARFKCMTPLIHSSVVAS